MKHLPLFEDFVKKYGDKMSQDDFEKLPEGSEVLYKGARYKVEKNNGATIVIRPLKGGNPTMVNLNQFIHGGAIVESYESFLNEGFMSDLDIIRQESQNLKDFIKNAIKDYPQLKGEEKFLEEIWNTSKELGESHVNESKNFNGNFSSIKDLYLGLQHLFPSSKIDYYPKDIYSGDKRGNVGYIGIKIDKDYHIIQYVQSEYGGEGIGLIWIDQRKNKRFEFSNLEYLSEIIEKNK